MERSTPISPATSSAAASRCSNSTRRSCWPASANTSSPAQAKPPWITRRPNWPRCARGERNSWKRPARGSVTGAVRPGGDRGHAERTGQAPPHRDAHGPRGGFMTTRKVVQGADGRAGAGAATRSPTCRGCCVEADVLESEAARVAPRPVRHAARPSYPGPPILRVTNIYPILNGETRTAQGPLPRRQPGLRPAARISLSTVELPRAVRHRPVMSVPEDAVIDTGTRQPRLRRSRPGQVSSRAASNRCALRGGPRRDHSPASEAGRARRWRPTSSSTRNRGCSRPSAARWAMARQGTGNDHLAHRALGAAPLPHPAGGRWRSASAWWSMHHVPLDAMPDLATRRSSSIPRGTARPISSKIRSPIRSSRRCSARRRSRPCAASPTSATPTSTSSSRTARISTGRARASSNTCPKLQRACRKACRPNSAPTPPASAGSSSTPWSMRPASTRWPTCAATRIGTLRY